MSEDTPDRRLADGIFDKALDLHGEERESYVAEACAGDPELEALVRRLIANFEAEEGPELSTGGALSGTLAEELDQKAGTASNLVGQKVGRYWVLSELGRGGMAIVYLAEREEAGVRQQVALKVLHSGIHSDDMLRRFQLERQILARISHPGMALFMDAGATALDQPYLVMEYVKGQPIDSYCDKHRLTIEERLRLFNKVAGVVAHAHRNLIVHRDIKPSNILVTDDGDVKLLDFGIAKLLDPDGETTRSEMRAMTPTYASPEQILGGPITTATDIYQLGMLLYVILTGRWPYRTEKINDVAVLKVICDTSPLRPSSVLKEADSDCAVPGLKPPTASQLEGARRATIRRLCRTLSGDLDTILGMALRKEPERRYASVDLFITDIERFLTGQTVTARPDSLTYRLRKLVMRNVAFSVLCAAALIAPMILTSLYTSRLERERDVARSEAAKATEMSDFLRGLFEVSLPTRTKGETITARDLLNSGAERLEAELADQPELQAMLGTVIGEVYGELALYKEARILLETAVARRREHPGPDGLDLASSLYALGHLCERVRDLETANASLLEALALREAALGPNHALTALTRNWLGVVAYRDNRFADAKALLVQALRENEAIHGPDALEVGKCLNHLALVLRENRELEASVAAFERGLAILDSHLGKDNPLPAAMRVNYADAVRYAGNPERANELLTEALPRMETIYGAEHPNIGVVLTSHANLLRSQGDYAEAERLQRRGLAVWETSLGPDHVQVSWCYNNLGLIRREQGDQIGARKFFQECIDLVDRTLGPNDAENGIPLNNLAGTYAETGDPATARSVYRRALAIQEATYGPEHSFLHRPLRGLGLAELALDRPAEAEALLRRALTIGRDHESYRMTELVLTRIDLAHAVHRQGRVADTREILREAAEIGGEEAAAAVAEAREELGL